jgi:hypothetical protein
LTYLADAGDLVELGQARSGSNFDHAVDKGEEGRGFGPNETRSMDAVDIIRVGRDLRILTSIGCFLLHPVGIRRGSNVIRFPSASALCQAVYGFKSFFRAVLMVAIPAHPSVPGRCQ